MSQLCPALRVPPRGSQPHVTAVPQLPCPGPCRAGSRSCSCSCLPAGTAGVVEGLGGDEPAPLSWRGTGSWAAKCSRVPAQQEHAGPESQAGVAEALTCPLGVVVERVPSQGPSCEHPMVLGRPDPSGAHCQSQVPAPALSPPHPGLGSIPLTALYAVSLVPKSLSHRGLRAQTQTFRSLLFFFFQQSCKELDTVTQIQDLEPQIKMVVVLPF